MKNRVFIALAIVLFAASGCNRDPNVAKKKYVESGNKYFERGKYKESLIMYKNAIRRDPLYGEAYYRAALAEIKLGRYVEAAGDLNRAVERQPDNVDAYVKLSNIYLNAYVQDRRNSKLILDELKSLSDRMSKHLPNTYDHTRLNGYISLFENDPKGALEDFQKANEMKPYQPDLVLVYMQTLAGTGRPEEAEKIGLEMISKDPSALTIYDALFVQYLRSKRVDEAERILKLKVEKNPKAADAYMQLAAHYYTLNQRPQMLATIERVASDAKQFPNGRLLAGDFFLRIRDYDLALQNYREGINQNPSDKAPYRKRMIDVLVKQNKTAEANQVVAELVKDSPKDNEAIALRAALMMLNGRREDMQKAVEDLQHVVKEVPTNPVFRYNLGRAQLAMGNADQARTQFEEAIKIRPDYILPRINLAQLLLQRRDFGRTVQLTNEILSYDPANVPARLLRSRGLMGLGEYKQAREDLAQTAKQFPNLAEARLQVAALDLQEGKVKEAEGVFRDLYSKSGDPRAMMGLVESLVRNGETPKAVAVLQEELAKTPDRTDYRVALGNIAMTTGDFSGAMSEYKKALEKAPKSPDLWLRMGEAQRRSGDTQSAAASFAKAKEFAPNNPDAYLQLALLHEMGGEREQARPMYEQVLRLQPNNPVALNNLAFMLADLGTDLDTALTMAQKAKQQNPNDGNISDTLGFIYIKKNLTDPAISIYRDLINKDPNRPLFRYHHALALAQKGDKPSAKRELEAALKGKPAKEEESKIRDLMAKLG